MTSANLASLPRILMARPPPCPLNSLLYNASLCACSPGHYLTVANGTATCALFSVPPGGDFTVHSASGPEPSFLTTVFDFDRIRRFTQSQAVFLECTLFVLVLWLVFCVTVRFGRLNGGRSVWFKIRWWISRLDVCYDTKHWLDDRKVQMKRRTELGGTFSIASWIVFIGLLSALLYQIITKRTIEVHRLKPTNAPDFISFLNDMEFNITTISSMTCSHLRGLGTLMTGTPGSVDFRISPLSSYANYSCYNTTRGPTISIKCDKCHVPPGNFYISWKFIDIPKDPATAVAFHFNLTAKDHHNDKRMSYVSGTVTSTIYANDAPKTFRGPDANVLIIRLFPQIYYNLNNLSIMQPLFHDFLPGSSFSKSNELQASLQKSNDGMVNMTLYIKSLSDYIVEVDNESILGPVSFLADVGGLCAFTSAFFLYFLLQCEYRFKKLRNEDIAFWNTISRKRARRHWDKLRKYVMYTWGPNNLDGGGVTSKQGDRMLGSFRGIGSQQVMRNQVIKDSTYLDKMNDAPVQTNIVPESTPIQKLAWSSSGIDSKGRPLSLKNVNVDFKVSEHEVLKSKRCKTLEQSES